MTATSTNRKTKKNDPEALERDREILEAVEAGIESGISMGIIEAYNFLVVEGHAAAAESLMQLIAEDEEEKIKA
jgi:hypothetical protein